jgi:hypothetical protein
VLTPRLPGLTPSYNTPAQFGTPSFSLPSTPVRFGTPSFSLPSTPGSSSSIPGDLAGGAPDVPGYVPVPSATTGFTAYASANSPFGQAAGASWLTGAAVADHHPPAWSAAPLGLAGAATPWAPYGTPYSVEATVDEDLRAAGVKPREAANVFGSEAYIRQKQEEEKLRQATASPQPYGGMGPSYVVED